MTDHEKSRWLALVRNGEPEGECVTLFGVKDTHMGEEELRAALRWCARNVDALAFSMRFRERA